MANTFSQIYLQFVFAVQGRQSLIPKEHKEELHKYITSLVQARKVKMLAVHCMPDHIHLFVGFNPAVLVSDFVKEIKVKSNEFINGKNWINGVFRWQEGYGVFSYGHSQIDIVCKYVLNQEEHHRKKTFKEEYLDFLEKFEVSFEERFLFEWTVYGE
jgi:REP element-mobilizing transposase RayT